MDTLEQVLHMLQEIDVAKKDCHHSAGNIEQFMFNNYGQRSYRTVGTMKQTFKVL